MLAKLELRHQYICKKKNSITARENIEQKAKFKGQNKLNRGELEGARPFINVFDQTKFQHLWHSLRLSD